MILFIKKVLLYFYLPLLITVLIVVVFESMHIINIFPKVGYVDSGRLLKNYNDAIELQKRVNIDENEFKKNVNILKDSIDAHLVIMKGRFDSSNKEEKEKLRIKLTRLNNDLQRYESKGKDQLKQRYDNEFKSVYDRINMLIISYGDKYSYDMIIGANETGNLLYGANSRFDLTTDLIEWVNKNKKLNKSAEDLINEKKVNND